ncbi:hypothetical protein [Lentzea sp. NPDC004782]|uniref:hypothetical protein n=1 Tax=Lentzea sp. NPDC004782 TaxID=3154458 RepID=UPI0033ADB701
MERSIVPAVRAWPDIGRVELTFAEKPVNGLTRVTFTSPVRLDLVDDRLISVNVLHAPELLWTAVRGVASIANDSGWLWITLAEGTRATRRWVGSAGVEFALEGPRLVSVVLELDEGYAG